MSDSSSLAAHFASLCHHHFSVLSGDVSLNFHASSSLPFSSPFCACLLFILPPPPPLYSWLFPHLCLLFVIYVFSSSSLLSVVVPSFPVYYLLAQCISVFFSLCVLCFCFFVSFLASMFLLDFLQVALSGLF